jgi:hypothetical protein
MAAKEYAEEDSKGDREKDNILIASYIITGSDDEIPELPSNPPVYL